MRILTTAENHTAKKHVTIIEGESMTKQAAADECDINNIMAQFRKTGLLTHVRQNEGEYGDFTNALEYHECLNKLREADAMFSTMPSDLRAKFDNDPAKFLDFAQNPDNQQEMIDLGLSTPNEFYEAHISPDDNPVKDENAPGVIDPEPSLSREKGGSRTGST